MASAPARTYRTAAFASLAGVTARALRHYDRLGLLAPRRSPGGYRLYTDRDLETLEEIVALKFIGVPLKEIAAIRRRKRPFAQVLRAQREMLDARRRTLARAVSAIAAAEESLRSGAGLDAELVRRIIEVMHMDKQHDTAVATYTALLKAKSAHVSSLTTEQRATLKQQWSALFADIREAVALDEDPAGPRAQGLLDRWLSLLRGLAGPAPASVASAATSGAVFNVTPEIRDEVWARRAEWMPADAAEAAGTLGTAEQVLAHLRAQTEIFPGGDVMEFIRRARAARRAS